MLRPAILYREDIEMYFKNAYGTEDMFLYLGSLENSYPNIQEEETVGTRQFAIVDESKNCELVGYLEYHIDWVNDCVYRIGIFSFDHGNVSVIKDIFDEIERLIQRFHRIEFCMVEGNPAERNYDAFIKRHNGYKIRRHATIRDPLGKWRDDIMYEIIQYDKIDTFAPVTKNTTVFCDQK